MANHTKTSAFSWSASDEELQFQVDNYNTLPWIETFRGSAVIFLAALLGLSIMLGLLSILSLDTGTLVELVIYGISLYFIFKGHRWAIILAMILWTGDKAVQLYQISSSGQDNAYIIIVWWLLVMPYLYKALKVENLRRRSITSVAAATTSGDIRFCRYCGNRIDEDTKFCASCGKPVG